MGKKQEVKKHTSAIHTSGSLSLLERKASNILLFNAYDDLLSSRTHDIKISLLAELCGYNSNDREKLKDAIRNLASITVEWGILDSEGNEEEWGISSLLASVSFFKNGMCRYEYSEALSEKLKEPEIYGNINLSMQKRFASGYSLIIYEMCSQFKGLAKKNGFSYTKWLSLEQFKKILGVDDSEYYEQFKELNRKIIKPSVQEINGTLKKYIGTDILIEPEYKKLSRSVSDLRFKIKMNPQSTLPLEKDENEEVRKNYLYKELLDRGLNDKACIHIIQAYSTDYIKEKIIIVDNAEEKGKIKNSLSGYLNKAIKDDYKLSIKNNPIKKEKEKEIEKKQKESDEKKKVKSFLSKQIRADYIATLSEKEKEDLLNNLTADQPMILKKSITNLEHPALSSGLNAVIPEFNKILEQKLDSYL